MAPSVVFLPNDQTLTVSPVFGGFYFKSNELRYNHAPFPPGWTVVLHTLPHETAANSGEIEHSVGERKSPGLRPFTRPTLQDDHLFISSISQPSNNEFKPASSPTRQIAMMLWATLWWYFHQPEPELFQLGNSTAKIPRIAQPRGAWKININREGIFKSGLVLPKLERMGLISTEASSVGWEEDDKTGDGWNGMFVSRRAFWQLDARIFLFTLSPASSTPFPGTPQQSRPSSPSRQIEEVMEGLPAHKQGSQSPGPFHSTSHLPTYFPPQPAQLLFTRGVFHPLRPKPPRQGETFYIRYIPSVGQYLSFRVASFSNRPHAQKIVTSNALLGQSIRNSLSDVGLLGSFPTHPPLCDVDLLHKWMNIPRVSHFWGEEGPRSHQEQFLKTALSQNHSFPVIGCWDGKPFGYFEIYWVKEDLLGRHLEEGAGNYDRGIHCLIGEQEFRGAHRVKIWLSALVHYCWLADYRTDTVMMEPRVDNELILKYASEVGFYKEKDLKLPHKQASLVKIRRLTWESPDL